MKKVVPYSHVYNTFSKETDKLCFIHTMEAYIVVKRNKLGFHELAYLTLKTECWVKKFNLKKDIYNITSGNSGVKTLANYLSQNQLWNWTNLPKTTISQLWKSAKHRNKLRSIYTWKTANIWVRTVGICCVFDWDFYPHPTLLLPRWDSVKMNSFFWLDLDWMVKNPHSEVFSVKEVKAIWTFNVFLSPYTDPLVAGQSFTDDLRCESTDSDQSLAVCWTLQTQRGYLGIQDFLKIKIILSRNISGHIQWGREKTQIKSMKITKNKTKRKIQTIAQTQLKSQTQND